MNAQSDLDRRLARWFAGDAASPPPRDALDRILGRTSASRPLPRWRAGIGGTWVNTAGGTWSSGRVAALRPALLLALIGLLTVVIVGGTLIVGGRPATTPPDRPAIAATLVPAGAPTSLIMVAPDEAAGEIRVVRPDGRVHAVLDAGSQPPGGCLRVLAADGERVASVEAGVAIRIEPLGGSAPAIIAFPSHQSLGLPAFSPDGSRVAYLDPRSDRSDLTIVSLIDGQATVVARDLLNASLSWDSWSVDDTLAIGYISDTESGIDLIQADGSNHRVLIREPLRGPSNTTGMAVTWSADGTHLAFAPIWDDGEAFGGTRIVEAATGRSTVVATADGAPFDAWRWFGNRAYFLWSPDGRTVVYPTETGLTLLDIATGAMRTLADPHPIRPIWSPDGSRIAFLTNDGSAFQPRTGVLLSSVPPGTTDSGRLTTVRADLTGRVDQDVAFGARRLAWSPDGRQIAVLGKGVIDLHAPDAKVPPTRISSEVAWSPGSCLSWSRVAAP